MMGMDMSNVTAPYATMMANMMSSPYMNQFMAPMMQQNWSGSLQGKNMMWMNEQKVSFCCCCCWNLVLLLLNNLS